MTEVQPKINGSPHPHGQNHTHHSPPKKHSPRSKGTGAHTRHKQLPPGWEKVESEGGVYYWHKGTGKTTWKFPSTEAKEHRMMMQTHTYINIRPGHKPQVVKQASMPLFPSTSQASHPADRVVANGVANGGGDKGGRGEGGVKGGGDGGRGDGGRESGHSTRVMQVKRKEKKEGEGDRVGKPAAVVERPPLPPPQPPVEMEGGGSQDTALNAEKRMSPTATKKSGAVSEPGREGERSPSNSPTSGQRRPLLVHHYENFPFSPSGDAGEKNKTPGNRKTSPTSSQPIPINRRESETSQISITPPLPERNYSQSEINCSPTPPIPERHYLSPSPPGSAGSADLPGNVFVPIQNSMETASPESTRPSRLTQSGRERKVEGEDRTAPLPVFKSSQPRVVERAVSQQGSEYAVINPAWKKNVKGRPPSLSGSVGGEGDKSSTLGSDTGETPPPLPARPVDFDKSLERSVRGDARGYVDLDSSFVEKKREELDVSSRFSDSVQYAVVQLESPTGPNAKLSSPPRGKRGPRTGGDGYEQVDLEERRPTNDDYMTVDSSTQQKHREFKRRNPPTQGRKHERWMKTQSAHLSPSPISPVPPSPVTPSTPTGTSTPKSPNEDGSRSTTLSPDEPEKPALPPKPGKTGEDKPYDLPSNARRLHAINVTIRRPTDGSGYASLHMTKEALLLRSGVTLRPGVRPPPSYWGRREEGSESGGSTLSGSDEEDGLEPVNRAIKSLESSLRMSSAIAATSSTPTKEEGGGVKLGEGDMKLAKAPTGPPSWMNFQRRPHNYEDVDVSSPSPPNEYHGTGIPPPPQLDSSRSVGNLHMAWDESDFSTRPQPIPGAGKGMVSASQPCLVDPSAAFPHLVKPDRVSEQAFRLRKVRLMQHRYEDIDIPDWPDVGVVPGSVSSVGDVNQLTSAIRNSWLDVEKEGAVTESGTQLPSGWQRLEDEQGKQYFWHVPTGRTQYTKPTGEQTKRLSLSLDPSSDQSDLSTTSSSMAKTPDVRGHKFSVRYLANYPVEENDLVPGQCVKIVHNSINKTNSSQVKGKPIFLVIRGMELQWVEPESSNPVTIQPINRIRVWGIGLENERDFGYVARDPVTKKHKCHVFRCDMPARAVAKALLENHQMMNKPQTPPVGGGEKESEPRGVSPDVPSSHERPPQSRAFTPPSQLHQSCETMVCVYIGSCEVPRALGIDILNSAVEKLSVNKSRWTTVGLSIAPSSIQITDMKNDKVLHEHRVRFLCFLGIGKDDRFCGYILESGRKGGEKKFTFHGFRMEPNTDRLCLALHTACQARYQRVLDANPGASKTPGKEIERGRSKSTSSILGRLGSFKKTKKDEDSKPFVVHYLGCQQVMKSEGLEVVKGPIQQLSIPKSSTSSAPNNLVEFEVSPAGLSIVDPQKRFFSKKSFNVKHITYVVRIRNYFAFVARESGRYQCHVFLESEVDAATIVTTIQRMLAPEPKQKR